MLLVMEDTSGIVIYGNGYTCYLFIVERRRDESAPGVRFFQGLDMIPERNRTHGIVINGNDLTSFFAGTCCQNYNYRYVCYYPFHD